MRRFLVALALLASGCVAEAHGAIGVTLVGPYSDGPTTYLGVTMSKGHFSGSGWTCQSVIDNGVVTQLNSLNPTIALVIIGRNDELGGASSATTATRMLSLADTMFGASSFTGKIYLGGPVPNTSTNTTSAATAVLVKAAIEAHSQNGLRLFYVPYQDWVQSIGGGYWPALFNSGITPSTGVPRSHPIEPGYDAMGTFYASALGQVADGSTIMPIGDSQMYGTEDTRSCGPRCALEANLEGLVTPQKNQGLLLQ
jgi:hypothetical protein